MMGNESKQANTMQERPGSDEAVILAAAAVVAREKDSSAVASKMKNQVESYHSGMDVHDRVFQSQSFLLLAFT